MKKKLLLTITTSLLMLSLLPACAPKQQVLSEGKDPAPSELPEGAISVLSNYPNLTALIPGEFNYDDREDSAWARYGFNCYVTTVNGQLSVLSNHTLGNSSTMYVGNRTEYISGGFVGNSTGVYLDGVRVIDEPCVGMVSGFANCSMLLFTATETEGNIYGARYVDDRWVLTEKCISLGSPIRLIHHNWTSYNADPPAEMYVVTETGFYILYTGDYLNQLTQPIDLSTVEMKQLKVPEEYWHFMSPTAITQTDDGIIYISELCGIVGVNPQTETFTYYPIDYFSAQHTPE